MRDSHIKTKDVVLSNWSRAVNDHLVERSETDRKCACLNAGKLVIPDKIVNYIGAEQDSMEFGCLWTTL